MGIQFRVIKTRFLEIIYSRAWKWTRSLRYISEAIRELWVECSTGQHRQMRWRKQQSIQQGGDGRWGKRIGKIQLKRKWRHKWRWWWWKIVIGRWPGGGRSLVDQDYNRWLVGLRSTTLLERKAGISRYIGRQIKK